MSTSALLTTVEEVRHKWGWLLVLGIAMVILGIVALGMIPVTTVARAIVFGWLLNIAS